MEKETLLKILLLVILLAVVLIFTLTYQTSLFDPFKNGAQLGADCSTWVIQSCPTGDNGDKIPSSIIKAAMNGLPNCKSDCSEIPDSCMCDRTEIKKEDNKFCCYSGSSNSYAVYDKKADCPSDCADDSKSGVKDASGLIEACYYKCCSAAIGNDILKAQLHDKCGYRC